jgi:hypothetical protein
MRDRNIAEDQLVDIVSHFGAERRRAAKFKAVPYEIPRGCAAAYYPETNVLVPVAAVALGSNQPRRSPSRSRSRPARSSPQ